MLYRFLIHFTPLFFSLPFAVVAQPCSNIISGYVLDMDSEEPLQYVNIYSNSTKKGAVSDALDYFQIEHLCPDEYHLTLSHIGCEPRQIYIQLQHDTMLRFFMEHSIHSLEGVTVSAATAASTTQNKKTISEQSIVDQANQNLSNILEGLSGVSVLKNGSGIAKPVIHGLFGNRITILNNGIAQSGQQWGNDHSPEIDPLVASKLTVVKGASAIRYPGSKYGSVILVEPERIHKEPHLHGRAGYFYESNGRGHGVTTQIGQFTDFIGWKINGTLKKYGDRSAPNYFLRNTGNREVNLAVQLEKPISDRMNADQYFSTFNSKLGVLRGSHIGNLTDLRTAFEREEPFFTHENFSYGIDAPYQQVNHHLLKLKTKFFLQDNEWLEVTFATQLNIRKEFDVRRQDRVELPALSLKQYSYFAEAKYNNESKGDWSLESGVQTNMIDNTNDSETGILPLIPDYYSYENALYLITQKRAPNSLIEFGLRYDNVLQRAAAISQSLPRKVLRFNNDYHNISATAGWSYDFNKNIGVSTNLGLSKRNPAINELYSGGLHQGVSGIEDGSSDLTSEHSVKGTFSLKGQLQNSFSFEALAYYHNIENFIFLNPQDDIRLTIRGAFPVFKYEQTNATIYGFDATGQLDISNSLHTKFTYSYIRGRDRENDLALINMPSNNLIASVGYEIAKISMGQKQLENVEFGLTNRSVFRRSDIVQSQDFVLPPDGYNLTSIKLASDLQLGGARWRITIQIDNLFDVEYRDYLNRQRYFADDLGRNFVIGFSLKF